MLIRITYYTHIRSLIYQLLICNIFYNKYLKTIVWYRKYNAMSSMRFIKLDTAYFPNQLRYLSRKITFENIWKYFFIWGILYWFNNDMYFIFFISCISFLCRRILWSKFHRIDALKCNFLIFSVKRKNLLEIYVWKNRCFFFFFIDWKIMMKNHEDFKFVPNCIEEVNTFKK